MDPNFQLGTSRISVEQFDRQLRMRLGIALGPGKTEFVPVNYGTGTQSELVSQISAAVQPLIRNKQDQARFFKLLENHYLVRIIRFNLTHDVFYRHVDYNRLQMEVPIQIHASDEKLVEKAYDFLQFINYPRILREVLDQVYALGEYLTFVDKKNKQLDDLFAQDQWRAVYLRGKLKTIVVNTDRDFPPDAVNRAIIFRIRHLPVRTEVRDPSEVNYVVYMGMPIIGPEILQLINTIRMLEALMPISQILSVQSSQLIYLRVPPGSTAVEEAFKLARQYEYFLNSPLNALNSTDPMEVVFNAARYRVVPLFGEKGSIEPRPLDRPNPVDMQALGYFRQALSDAIPMPGVYFGIQDQLQDRSKVTQYFQLIDSIRKAIADFTHDVLLLSLEGLEKDPEFSVEPVRVLGISEAQLSDYIDLSVATLSNLGQAISTYLQIVGEASEYLDLGVLREVFNMAFYPLTAGRDLLTESAERVDKSETEPFEEEMGEPPEASEEEAPSEEESEEKPEGETGGTKFSFGDLDFQF